MQQNIFKANLLSFILSFFSILAEERNTHLNKPNILWITSEDNGAQWLSAYGSKNGHTPNIDQLAREGFLYTHCYANAPVCAPSRFNWISGTHAVTAGTLPMRSRCNIPLDLIKYYPDLLRQQGYFVTNSSKTDFNIGNRPDNECFDKTLKLPNWEHVDRKQRCLWRLRPKDQPFFTVLNLTQSHESKSFTIRKGTRRAAVKTNPASVTLHPYHPDLSGVRESYARYTDSIKAMDNEVGDIISQLKKDKLYEETIIVYISDHGGVMPRSKGFLYNSGTHCPLIIRIPKKWQNLWPKNTRGNKVDRLISFIDLPKTWISLAGAQIPKNYQGKIFLGNKTETESEYHFAYRDRIDLTLDMMRMVRNKDFIYIKNYMPWAPSGQHRAYTWNMEATKAWHQHYLNGKCNKITGRFFEPRSHEELYHHVNDYHNTKNLINSPAFQDTIDEMRLQLKSQQLKSYDSGFLPEIMRLQRAQKHQLSIYEMVRRKDIYPLQIYIDFVDMILQKKSANLPKLIAGTASSDDAIRFWSLCGLAYLGDSAASAKNQIKKCMDHSQHEVKMMAYFAYAKSQNKSLEIKSAFEKMIKKFPEDRRANSPELAIIQSLYNLL